MEGGGVGGHRPRLAGAGGGFELFRGGRPAEYLRRRGVHVIGYRALRSLLPARDA